MMSASGTSAASAVLKSTPEKRNFLLLTRLLIAGGTRLVRDVFDNIHPPHTLPAVLSSPLALSKLKRPYVTKPQLDLLYPAPGVYGKSEDFDITLLLKLLREICGLTPPVSTGSWDKLPVVIDLSLEADLARLKYYRNDIYGHTNNMEITEVDFNVNWQIIKEVMLRLAQSISPAKETEWKNAIDKLHGDPLTPADAENVKELKRWYLFDMKTKEEVIKLQKSVKKLSLFIANKVDEKADKIEKKADNILREVGSNNEKVDEIEKKTDDILREVGSTNKKADEIEKKTNDIMREASSTNKRADEIEKKADDILREVGSTNEKVDEIEKKTDDILREVRSTNRKIQKILPAKQSSCGTPHNQETVHGGVVLNRSQAMNIDFSNGLSITRDQTGFSCWETQPLPPEVSICDSDINYFAKFYDPSTRQWLLDDFRTWFNNPCDPESRAYMLLGDAGIGKSVMAAVLAKQMRDENQLGAAFFCKHNDSTRRNPRYLISSVAYQLCNCSTMYYEVIGGFDSIQKFVANHELGVHELFTKLLQEPLSCCPTPAKRQLVVVDALDESQYEGHSDLLDLITQKFPFLPPWIVFFITSRPEERIQDSLEDFRPCVRICSIDGQRSKYFMKHCEDLRSFIKGKVKGVFCNRSCNTEELETELVEKIVQKCEGLFLYARHIIEYMQSETLVEPSSIIEFCPKGVRRFYLSNFKRISAELGELCFKELVGCAIVSPGLLPTAFISVVLDKLGSQLTKQKVLDTISLFFPMNSNDDTFSFLHSLIPKWLCNEKEAREFFIDRKLALKTLGNFMRKHLDDITHNTTLHKDLESYALRYGVRFFCDNYGEEEATFLYNCLTNLVFAEAKMRIKPAMVYCLLEDYQICVEAFRSKLAPDQILTLKLYRKILLENAVLLSRFPYLVHQLIFEESGKCQQTNLDVRMTFCSLQPRSSFRYAFSSNRSLMALITEEELKWYITILSILSGNTLSKAEIPFSDVCRKPLFSPSDDLVFLGRVDKWFSVLKGTFVDISQFPSTTDCFYRTLLLDGEEFLVVDKTPRKCYSVYNLCTLFLFWNSGVFGEDSDVILYFLRKQVNEALGDKEQRYLQVLERTSGLLNVLNMWVTQGSEVSNPNIFSILIDLDPCFPSAYFTNNKKDDKCLYEELPTHYFKYHLYERQSFPIYHIKTGKFLQEMYSFSELLHNYLKILTGFAKAWCNSSMTPREIPLKSNACLWYIFGSQCFGESAEVKSFQGGFAVLWDAKVVLFTDDRLYILSSPLRVSSFEVSPNGMWIAVCGSLYSSASVCDMQLCIDPGRSVLSVINVCRPNAVKIVAHDVIRFKFSWDNRHVLYQKRDGSSYACSVQDGTVLGFVRESSTFLQCLFSDGTHSEVFPVAELATVQPSICNRFLAISNDIVGICFFLSSVVVVSSTYGKTSIDSLKEFNGEMISKKNVCIYVGRTRRMCVFSDKNHLILVLDKTIAVLSEQFEMTPTTKVESQAAEVLSYSCDGKRVLLCLSDGLVQIVDMFSQEKIELSVAKLGISIECGCFVPGNESLVVLCSGCGIQVWEHVQQKCLENCFVPLPNPQVKLSFCICSVKSDLLACCIGDTVKVFSFFPNERPVLRAKAQLSGHCGCVTWCQFIKEGRYLVTHGVDRCILFWDLCERDPVGCTSFTSWEKDIVAVAVSPEEEILMCALSSGLIAEIKLEGLDVIKQYSFNPVPKQPREFRRPAVTASCGISMNQSFHKVKPHDLLEDDEFWIDTDESSDSDDV